MDELPSRQTQGRFASEMKAICRDQIEEHFVSERNTTLKYDGTTKSRVGHLVECELASKEKTYLVGLRQQAGGTSDEYISAIRESISDVNPSLLDGIANTMTDRASVNTAIDRKLSDLKGECHINSFRCGMHPLDTLGKACDNALKESESQDKYHRLFKKRGESNTACLIRKVSDLFHNEATGCGIALTSFLKTTGCPVTTFPRWVGNRFNILFKSAKCLVAMMPFILNYFQKIQKPTNDLQSALYQYLQDPHLQACICCLALISLKITEPWMKMLGTAENILGINTAYQEAVDCMSSWEMDPQLMLSTNRCAFGECVAIPFIDDMNDARKAPLCPILEKMMHECVIVCKRQLEDQLQGGVFWEPGQDLCEAAASCSSTNISGERQFAKADSLLHRAPNISVGKMEAKVMFSSNDTRDWLECKSAEEKKKTITSAMKKGKEVRKHDIILSSHVSKAIKEKNEANRLSLTEKEKKHREKIEEVIEHVLEEGVMEGTSSIDEVLSKKTSKTSKKNFLTNQIKFQQLINPSPNKQYLSKCNVEELHEILENECARNQGDEKMKNILMLIKHPTSLVRKNFTQKWEDNKGVEVWWNGVVQNYNGKEYEIEFNELEEFFYMTQSEIICDIISNDLKIL
ncbi:uncharacterized protein LOC121416104 [Lytechinus variegatus]|uniref:uncharacterized protein LOC121416104 n=1 Tax=Lytechinus variegatus TaxID=7654 RepID=UPI001BB11C6F|nr:uncharacterized protein LOC121416104 [Lytechinus variegatus]